MFLEIAWCSSTRSGWYKHDGEVIILPVEMIALSCRRERRTGKAAERLSEERAAGWACGCGQGKVGRWWVGEAVCGDDATDHWDHEPSAARRVRRREQIFQMMIRDGSRSDRASHKQVKTARQERGASAPTALCCLGCKYRLSQGGAGPLARAIRVSLLSPEERNCEAAWEM